MWRTLQQDFSASALMAALLATLVSYSGPFLIMIHAAQSAHLSAQALSSWIWAVSVGAGVAGVYLSWRWKMPVITAWSTPGAAILLAALPHQVYAEAIGAYLVAAVLIMLIGASGVFDRLMRVFPPTLAAAMLAGILFRFVAELISALGEHVALILPMLVLFFIGRRRWPRYALACAIILGAALTLYMDPTFNSTTPLLGNGPHFVVPEWSVQAMLNVALPLTIVALSGQFLPGMAVLHHAGYTLEARSPVTTLGFLSLLTAPFGGHGVTLAAITAAICTGPDAHPNPHRRYIAGVVSGGLYILIGVLGGYMVTWILSLPKAFIVAAAGLALFSTLAASLEATLRNETHREAGLLTFMVAASGVSWFGLGAPLWALLAGLGVMGLMQYRPRLQHI